MKPHEERVVKEKDELDEKAEKLCQFIETDTFKNLPKEDIKLLKLQLCAMDVYSGVLGMRIDRFKTE